MPRWALRAEVGLACLGPQQGHAKMPAVQAASQRVGTHTARANQHGRARHVALAARDSLCLLHMDCTRL